VLIGILEGVAEAAGLSKGYFESARMWRERESICPTGLYF
jgi:hypothetical protein